jgi:threonine synthase
MTLAAIDYVSTRGSAPTLTFAEVVLAGLASDGGLYVPAEWPHLTSRDFADAPHMTYAELTARTLALFAAPDFAEPELAALAEDAYRSFDGNEVAPLVPLDDQHYLLELFHGPTLAFKDFALQMLGRLFEFVLAERGERLTIVGATSGDTGSAAIEACRDRSGIEVFILHPKDRVSAVQRRQMTTVESLNIHNIAVEGTFDDCQDLVKAMFNDAPFRTRYRLSAVNSINWARIAAQVPYYVSAALRLGGSGGVVSFAVPTGNFGNVLAAWVAKRIGAPIGRLIIGSNSNDILTRFFATGRMEVAAVVPTLSPSMDIQISSNFERYLYELLDRNGTEVAATMQRFRQTGGFSLPEHLWRRACDDFVAVRCDDTTTVAIMDKIYRDTGRLIDPHTAVGIAAARVARHDIDGPIVTVATAHPAKFPDVVEAATGVRPSLPARLSDLFERRERITVLPANLAAIEAHIAATMSQRGITA